MIKAYVLMKNWGAGHQYDGAIMITASHLPFQRNGFKFFTPEGGLEKVDISAVLALAAQAAAEAGVVPGDDFLGDAYTMTMALNVPAGLVSQVPPSSIVCTINFFIICSNQCNAY